MKNPIREHKKLTQKKRKIPWHYSPLSARACQPTASLTFICPKIKVKDYPVNLTVTCGQNVDSPNIVKVPGRK